MISYILMLDTEEERTLFEELYETYRHDMYRVAYSILKNAHDAEDVVHESFIALLPHMNKLVGNDPRRTWSYMLTIVKRRSFNLYKKRRRHLEEPLTAYILESEEFMDEGMEEKMMHKEQREFILKYVESLPETQQEVVIMRYYYGMNGPMIAKILDKTVDNVRHILMRARKRILEMMKERGYPDED